MSTLVYLYTFWLFTNTAIRSAVPALGFLQYADELFLLVATVYLWQVRRRQVLLPELRRLLLVLLAVHGVSWILNWSPAANLVLILVAYAKPLAWAGVVYVLMSERPGFRESFEKTLTGGVILQIPFVLLQALAGGAAIDNYDIVIGTFGPAGGLELGYMLGMVSCWLIPELWLPASRLRAAAGLVLTTGMVLASATKQLFLLFAAALPVHFGAFGLVRVKTLVVVAVVVLAIVLGLPAVSPLGYEDYLAGADVLADVTQTRKVEGLVLSGLLFWENPMYFLVGTGPGMFTSFVALNAETPYARLINYAYYLQKPGEAEEGLGGTFNQAASSFLSVVGETGFVGLAAFAMLLTFPFRYLRRIGASRLARQRSFLLTLLLGLGCLVQVLLEGGIAIHYFWALQVMLIVDAEKDRNASSAA